MGCNEEDQKRVFDEFLSDPESFSTTEGFKEFCYWRERSAFKAQLKANA